MPTDYCESWRLASHDRVVANYHALMKFGVFAALLGRFVHGSAMQRGRNTRAYAIALAGLARLVAAGSLVAAPRGERLLNTHSPYLQQHADNPVEWFPWGDEAFARAQQLRRPVMVTIGYSSSPWCRKAEADTFMDPDTAKFMNDKFVSVLLDREEHPELDRASIQYLLETGQSPTWPMHVFLTHERLPVFASPYLPESGGDASDKLSLVATMKHVATSWNRAADSDYMIEQSRRDAIKGQKTIDARARQDPRSGIVLTREQLPKMMRKTMLGYDRVNGGSASVPKFPLVPMLMWMHQFAVQFPEHSVAKEAAEQKQVTLRGIASGAIRDHIGGGFHRYALDEKWRLPSFEKTLFDQALLGEAFALEYVLTGDPLFKDVSVETFGYMMERLATTGGGFFSAEDAVSPRSIDDLTLQDGAFYLWAKAEFDAVLEPDPAARRILTKLFRIRTLGNAPLASSATLFQPNMNLIYWDGTPATVAATADVPAASAAEAYQRGIALLGQARSNRPRPLVDQKVLVSWNAMAIAALARASVALDEPALLVKAEAAVAFLLEQGLIDPETGDIRRSWMRELSSIEGICEDYATMIDAVLALYHATNSAHWLDLAEFLQTRQDTLFLDEDTGAYFEAAKTRTDLFLRLRPALDSDIFSSNGLTARNLVRLSKIPGAKKAATWKDRAMRMFDYFEPTMLRQWSLTPGLLSAWEEFTRPVE